MASMAPVRRLVHSLRQSLETDTDAELLDHVARGEEAAFEAIVRRHGPLVLTAARSVLANSAEVDDVFQAAFLALWRDAGRIRKRTALACWLYGVARRAALKAQARLRRRQQVEAATPAARVIPAPDLSWGEACRTLHEEIDRLPAHYRGPVVLCHLNGRSRDEAARELGWSFDVLRGRLERARELLKRRLTRRGVGLSAGLLAALTGEPVSAALVSTTLKTAINPPGHIVGLLPSATPLLRRLTAFAAVVLISIGVIGGLARTNGVDPPAMPDDPKPPPPATIVLTGNVVDTKGNAVPGAKIDAFRYNGGGRKQVTTDDGGRFTLELPARGDGSVNLVAAAPGHAPAAVKLPPARANVTVTLPEPVPLIGKVLTLEGQPVAGAEVRVEVVTAFEPGELDRSLKEMREKGTRFIRNRDGAVRLSMARYGAMLPEIATPIKTDRDGRFVIPNVGRDRLVDLSLTGPTIQHVDLVIRTQEGPSIRIDHSDERNRLTIYGSPFEHLARPGRLLRGVVREKGSGKPVAKAHITAEGTTATTVTDDQGRYELAGCPKSSTYSVTAKPPDGSALFIANRRVADTAGLQPLDIDIDLLPGIRLTGRILDDKTGKPTWGFVDYHPLTGNSYLTPKRDATGTLHRPHFMTNQRNAADGSYSVVVAPGPGLVTVRGDGNLYVEPFLDPAQIFPGEPFDRSDWGDTQTLYTPQEQGRLMLRQSDYRTIVPINPPANSGAMSFDIMLVPAATVRARFVDPAGKPLQGVWTRNLVTKNNTHRQSGLVNEIDFEISAINPNRPLKLYAVHLESGLCGQFTVRGNEPQPLKFKLQPGITLTGQLVDRDGKPIVGAEVAGMWSEPGKNSYWAQNPPKFPVTDAAGRFRVPWLIPDHDLSLGVVLPRDNSVHHVGKRIEPMKAGQTLDLGTVTLITR